MTTTINASPTNGLVQTADGSGILKVQSNGVTTNALAWVNFNGTLTTPITPRANYNVGSITKNGTGDYTLNFTSALTDANYTVAVSMGVSGNTGVTQTNSSNITKTTSSFRLKFLNNATAYDYDLCDVAIFGN